MRIALAELTPEQDRRLAAHFEVAVSTVNRWRIGVSRPHPLVVKRIIRVAYLVRGAQ